MKQSEFPLTIKRGSVTVKIYHRPTKGCSSFTLSYWQDGQRKRPTFSDLSRAKREAETVACKLSSADAAILQLRSGDRAAYLRARELLQPLNVPIEVAVAQFVETKHILGDVPFRQAAEYYVKKNPRNTESKRVREVINEMLTMKRGDGCCEAYLRHLRYDLDKFAVAFECPIGAIAGQDICV